MTQQQGRANIVAGGVSTGGGGLGSLGPGQQQPLVRYISMLHKSSKPLTVFRSPYVGEVGVANSVSVLDHTETVSAEAREKFKNSFVAAFNRRCPSQIIKPIASTTLASDCVEPIVDLSVALKELDNGTGTEVVADVAVGIGYTDDIIYAEAVVAKDIAVGTGYTEAVVAKDIAVGIGYVGETAASISATMSSWDETGATAASISATMSSWDETGAKAASISVDDVGHGGTTVDAVESVDADVAIASVVQKVLWDSCGADNTGGLEMQAYGGGMLGWMDGDAESEVAESEVAVIEGTEVHEVKMEQENSKEEEEIVPVPPGIFSRTNMRNQRSRKSPQGRSEVLYSSQRS